MYVSGWCKNNCVFCIVFKDMYQIRIIFINRIILINRNKTYWSSYIFFNNKQVYLFLRNKILAITNSSKTL